MEKSEAISCLLAEGRKIPEGEEFVVDHFTAADGPGVARLFHAVYGDGYPIETYYIPERLVEANRQGSIRSVVARIGSGDVVAHAALHRSSPPNPNLFEFGVGLTLPAYRRTNAFSAISELIMSLPGSPGIDGFYGEAVCNHTITQKYCLRVGALETAVEPALMPAGIYRGGAAGTGRVGCIVYSRADVDERRKLHLPPRYREELLWLLADLNLDRELLAADGAAVNGQAAIATSRFADAGVARCTVVSPGEELTAQVAELERELRRENYALVQIFLDLGQAWSGRVVEQLYQQGFSFAGLLPIWFGTDALLLHKHFVDPEYDSMQIYSDRGRRLLELVRAGAGGSDRINDLN